MQPLKGGVQNCTCSLSLRAAEKKLTDQLELMLVLRLPPQLEELFRTATEDEWIQ